MIGALRVLSRPPKLPLDERSLHEKGLQSLRDYRRKRLSTRQLPSQPRITD